MKKIFLVLTMLFTIVSYGYSAELFTIRTADDWNKFRTAVENAKGKYDVDAILDADITVNTYVGGGTAAPYRGTFNGNCHTLNVNISRSDGASCAPFSYVGDVTIKDLHVTGKSSGGMHSAGLIGICNGSPTVTISRVWVSTEVTIGYTHAGGVIGHSDKATVKMNDCRFDGKVTTNSRKGTYAGDIIGWSNDDGSNWFLKRVYDHGSPYGEWMFYCICYPNEWRSWGTNSGSLTVTQHGWTNVDHYNKTDQNEVVNIMNGRLPGSWHVVDGKAVPVMGKHWVYLSSGSSSGKRLTTGYYYVTNDIEFSNTDRESGLRVEPGATVHIYVPRGVTLTARGGNASGRSGAGAGIELPQGSSLYLEGHGKVVATGGNAANGGNGSNGGSASADDSNKNWIHPGDGGAGGNGGGGAGAGIGTRGANGGAGGAGVGKGTIRSYAATCFDGVSGNRGSDGETASAMGNLYVDLNSGISVSATGGQAGAGGNAGSTGSYHLHNSTTWDHSIGGGSGGGAGGGGGKANKIGTGGPGGGGGGSGSSGTTCYGSKWKSGWFSVGSKGGKGGQNGEGGWAANASDAVYNGARGWDSGDNRASSGDGAYKGGSSRASSLDKEFCIQFNAVDQSGAVTKTGKAGYKSTTGSGTVTITVPSFNTLGLTDRDKYVLQWNTERDGTGQTKKVGDEYTIGKETKNFYGKWNDYKSIFPKGNGTQGDPFIIEEGELLELADYVNNGGNTRNVYFRQKGDVLVTDVLSQNNRGGEWTPIGHQYAFEGDYDGGGNRIRNAKIANEGTAVGIFGKVLGAIHNLGAENITINNSDENARCGIIAGKLMNDSEEQMTGWMRNCYSANNSVNAPYASCVVGEMEKNTSMSRCLEHNNNLGGSHAGSFASLIQENATVDMCFTSGGGIAPENHGKTTNCEVKAGDKMRSGELTWRLNDKTAFGVTWYQNVDTQGEHNDHPVLDSISSRVYYDGTKYSNTPSGSLFALSGKGVWNDPFLIKSKADFEKVAKFCNDGNKSKGIYFLQTTDIDLKDVKWEPIGKKGYNFDGHYDGGGYTIRNGNIKSENTEVDQFIAIFGNVTGKVTRLAVENMTVKVDNADHARVAAIAARLNGNGEISNCLVKNCNVVTTHVGVAGAVVADMFDQAVIKNCLVVNTSISATRIGYICSDTKSGTRIERCYTNGNALTSNDSYGSVDSYSLPGLDEASLERGEITYALNNNSDKNPEPVWYQNISEGSNKDKTPVLSSDHAMVYKKNGNYTNDGYDLGKLGKGTQEDPYKIGTPEDLQTLILSIGIMKRSNFYVRQTADIDLKDSLMVPIGTCIDSFEGHYDGGGHVIRNMEMLNYQGENMGLFNKITGVVENLGIENSKFKAEDPINRVGAFAGRLSGKGVLRNCYAKGCTIDFNNMPGVVVGALVGEQTDASRIESCYGYQNTVVGQDNGVKHYGHIVGYIGSNATNNLVFTDGPNLCADKQDGAKNISRSEKNVADLRFKTGEICYLLNGSKTDKTVAWGQVIKTDSLPTLTSHLSSLTSHLVYSHECGQQTQYTNTDEVPYTVWISLNPNHSGLPSKTIEMFKADDRYYVPNFNLEAYAEERMDYEFMGWNTQKDGKGTLYPYNYEVVPTENLPLYAVWDIKVPAETSGDGKSSVVTLEDLRKDTIYYKVYDYGGHNNAYGYNYNGRVTLQAPAGYSMMLTGTVATESADGDNRPRDYMTVYEADGEGGFKKLTNEIGDSVFFSAEDGVKKDIGRILSSNEEMIIEFVSDDENCYDGLDLLVTLMPKKIRQLGQGTENDPFLVANVEDLKTVDEYISLIGNSKIYIEQVGNIDMEDEEYEPLTTPLASSVASFEGHYDGGGYEIRNMKMADGGLFRNVSGVVERLGMVDCTVDGVADKSCIDIIAGRLSGSGQVRNCYAVGNTVSFVGQDKVFTMGTEYTKERFASGEICYLLNGSKTDSSSVWRQTLGTDSLPVLNKEQAVVYCYTLGKKYIYSNSATPVYNIYSKEDFMDCSGVAGDFYLKQDIDLGEWNHKFSLLGNFDGGGYTITYSSKGKSSGLFDYVAKEASVKHLRVEANVVTSKRFGGIVFNNEGTISDCHFRGNIHKQGITSRSEEYYIAGIAASVTESGVIDHCSATGHFTLQGMGSVYYFTQNYNRVTNCAWVDPVYQSQYADLADNALAAQADYPVYAKGILDAINPKMVLGNDTIVASGKHLPSLTIIDGERFSCPAEVTVDNITYKRRGTNGAYEPWVLPFDYTIDASMLNGGVEFYRFEKDSLGNIQTVQINSGETYQVAANEPLAFRTSNESEYNFQMKLVKDDSTQPMTIKMPADGVAASMASTKDIANLEATYDSISGDRTVKELMYIWDNAKDDFVLGDGETGLQPFRYYLQYIEKSTGKIEKFEDTDWGHSQAEAADSTSQANAKRLVARRAPLSTLTAEGWQPIFLDLFGSQEVTAEMLEDYDILGLWDLYDQKAANNQYAVSIIYVPVPADFELPYAAPLLVRAKHAGAKPLVTEQMARELNALLAEMAEQNSEEEVEAVFNELHYWCSTFNGRYDVWQMLMPEKDSLLNEYGALAFAENASDKFFYRVPTSDNATMTPMSYCFTAYDARTFENLPLANDRIEIVVMDLPAEVLGIENVQRSTFNVQRAASYNLNGQKVSDSYRGIVIQNGRKIRRR